jgi:predicted DNA-binding transcriptional regulator YafY
LKVLQGIGLPISEIKQGGRVRWHVEETFRHQTPILFTPAESMALLAAEKLLAGMKGSVLAEAAQAALNKVRATLQPAVRAQVKSFANALAASGGTTRNLKPFQMHYDALIRAIELQQVVRLTYQKLGAAQSEVYKFEPHYLHMLGSAVYWIGWAQNREAVRFFLLDRILNVEVTGDKFAPRPQVKRELFDHGGFGLWEGPIERVRLEFFGTAARIVEEQEMHRTQKITRNGDSILFEAQTPISKQLVMWVKGFGERARVVGPDKLKHAVCGADPEVRRGRRRNEGMKENPNV